MDHLSTALNHAQSMGAEYADIRIQKTTRETIFLMDLSLKNTSRNVEHGYGIRVMKNGAWGFAHSNIFSNDEVKKTVEKAVKVAELSAKIKKGKGLTLAHERGYIDSYSTKIQIDPFKVPLSEKVDLMLEVNKTLLNYSKIKRAFFMLDMLNDDKYFASTLGSVIHSNTYYINPMISATAVNDKDSQTRSFDEGGYGAGWEHVLKMNLVQKAVQIAEEAIIKLEADEPGEIRRRDLILDPNHLGLTMHESVGHPTELDRVLKWEADYAGVSFATPEKLKKYRYGSEIVNFVGDNTLSFGLATAGYDDDGVPGQKWYIIKDGILNEYGTTRDTAPFIGENMSRGCNRATYYYDFPINRIPNLYLEPGKKLLSPQELIADTEDGIYIEGRGSFSIDQHRVNFQFGGDMFWEIKNGKKVRPLKDVLYKSCNPEFWNSCDAICDARYWKDFGVTNCGKGQPPQTARMTHGAATARFKKIRVGGSK
ncbi:MAG TPA: TldD/PmbA family protein [Clostridiales bacterium]|nr:TldD/PmbA family protein [Clostridiales bacterium]HQP70439.1 TldD/PmbA family protein [Clostridiales bacterium]